MVTYKGGARDARSLEVLLDEINKAAPNRNKASDGGIGDAAHATRDSDHNPWVKDANGVGVVRARDFTHHPAGGLDCNELASFLAAKLGVHPALGSGAYVIWNGRIISTNRKSEGWRPYYGSNPHNKHLHLSVETGTGYDSRTPFGWGGSSGPIHNLPEEDEVSFNDQYDLWAPGMTADEKKSWAGPDGKMSHAQMLQQAWGFSLRAKQDGDAAIKALTALSKQQAAMAKALTALAASQDETVRKAVTDALKDAVVQVNVDVDTDPTN